MKTRILIWIDDGAYLQFCISKFLHDKIDCQIYAIADVNDDSKNFLRKQSIVKIDKLWLYRDNLPSRDVMPDVNYLENFENKYKINLWTIVYSERLFYKYTTYYKPKYDEILSILEYECKFFESVLLESNPEFLFIKNTDNQQNLILFELAKSFGIKVLTLASSKLANSCHISEDADRIDESSSPPNYKEISLNLNDYLHNHDPYGQDKKKKSLEMPTMKKRLSLFVQYLKYSNSSYFKNYFANRGKDPINFISKNILLIFKKYYREKFLDHMPTFIPDGKFVYFPLHVEPERSVLISAPFYSDQIYVISNIAKALPVGYYLLVKEHPSMALLLWRETSFYKEIMKLPNVKLVNPQVNPTEILARCEAVVTISGTIGLEALFYNKPVIVMSDTIYSHLPSVFRLQSFEDLPELIKKIIQRPNHYQGRDALIQLLEKESIPIDMINLQHDLMQSIGTLGMSEFIVPTEVDIQKFIKLHYENLNLLAEKCISKINLYREGKVIISQKKDVMRNA